MRLVTLTSLAGLFLFSSPVSAEPAFSESFLDAPGPMGPLKGTVLSPPTPSKAVVLIIPGSGPTDRDGNNPLGVKASTYRLLAEGLVSRGVTTLRIDKRGMFASSAAVKDANVVTIAEYVDDVSSWVRVLRKDTHAPCVWILGHSEGGLVALASAKSVEGECGLILVATPGLPMGDELQTQLKANPANAPLLGQAQSAIAALEQGRKVDVRNMHPALQGLFNPAVQGFLISEFSYDPARLIAGVTKPVLLLQGQRDLQVSAQDAQRLKQANPPAQLALLPDVNHVLKAVTTDDPRVNMAAYADPGLPLAPGVVDVIADFLLKNATAAE